MHLHFPNNIIQAQLKTLRVNLFLITSQCHRGGEGVKICNFWWRPSFLRWGFLWPFTQSRSCRQCANESSATLNIFATPLRTWRSPPPATKDAPCRGYEKLTCHRIPLPSVWSGTNSMAQSLSWDDSGLSDFQGIRWILW